MMSFALMGCLIFSASDAMAQGRSRSQGGSSASRSQSAAVSRSNNSSAPTVSRNNSSSSMSRSAATPQVSRSSSNTSHSTSAPKVDRMSSSSSHSATTPQVTQRSSSSSRTGDTATRVNRGATTRGGSDKVTTTTTGTTTRRTDTSIGHMGTTTKSDHSGSVGTTTQQTRPGNTTKPNGTRPNGGNGGNGGVDKPNKPNGGNGGNGGVDKPNKPNGGNGGNNNDRHGNKGGNDRHGNKGGSNDKGGFDRHGDRGGNHGNHRGFDPKNRFDYSNHHYRNEFSLNYRNHNWSRPLPPPARAYRLAPIVWYRPVIPVGWHPYAGAPVIDRILGLVFGSLYNTSLDYLYCNGYYIDGYADGIIYLRDVPMLNLYWPDVMLNYDYDRLVNAQFVYHSSYYDTSRFDRVYNSLSRIYGAPVYRDGMTVSWYGGDSRGYVTLSLENNYGDYYTTMSIGY